MPCCAPYKLPFWGLVTFGAYALISIGMSLMALSNCDKAAAELTEEIKEAKKDLKSKGFKFD